MKKGLLIYLSNNKKEKNIGDYIQGIAARQFTGKDVIYVEREHLNVYTGEPIKLIMNAWWMHKPETWPPSDKIKPLMISMHINPGKAEKMLSIEGVEYFKKHEPIGCRDLGTKRLLEDKGINAYYTGCLTLTLGKTYQHKPERNKVYFVDAFYQIRKIRTVKNLIKIFKNIILNTRTVISINKKRNGITLKDFFQSVLFYDTYSKFFGNRILRNAEFSSHMLYEPDLGDENSKFEIANKILEKYSNAELVVTSRIHAALPCVGIGTPSVYIRNEYFDSNKAPDYKGRFEKLIDCLNVIDYTKNGLINTTDSLIKKRIKSGNDLKNKELYREYAKKMSEQCESFLNNSF